MKKIAWITDTTASLTKEFIETNHIHVVPLQIIMGGNTYLEEVDITAKEFYEQMGKDKTGPSTSQPSIGSFVALYERLKEEYDMGIAIHATGELSGTYNASVQAAEMAGFPLIAIDSRIGSYPISEMIKAGLQLEKQGESIEVIQSSIARMVQQAELYLIPADLDQLRKSGRVSISQAILGTLIQLNLVLKFEDGKVELDQKIRTNKKAKQYLLDIIGKHAQNMHEICIIHANEEVKAMEWKQEIESLFPTLSVVTLMLCPVAGVHTGQGTMGIAWIPK